MPAPQRLTGRFTVLDTHAFALAELPQMRQRLTALCGASFFVRLQDEYAVEREIWESPEGQRFTVIFKGHPPHCLLCEIAYEDFYVIKPTDEPPPPRDFRGIEEA